MADTPPSFSIGIVTPANLRLRNRRRIKRVIRLRLYRRPIVDIPPIVFRSWYLLRISPDPVIAALMNRIGGSLEEAKLRLKGLSIDLNRTGPNSYGSPRLLGITVGHLKHAGYLIRANERFRKVLKVLSIKWRAKHLVKANDDDLITMEPPVKCVNLYDWKERRIYAFEASTALRCLTKRLLFHEGMFATPLRPVNPYTNVTLTLGQLHSVVEQLKSHGVAHWALESLRNMSYDWNDFITIHDNALQLEAMRQVFAELTSHDLHDALLDFIESEYLSHDVPMDKEVYRWAIENAIDSGHITSWRKLCYDYYRNQILYKDIPIKQQTMQQKISVITRTLVWQTPREIYRLRRRANEIQITGSDSTG